MSVPIEYVTQPQPRPTEATPWLDVHIWGMDTHDQNRAIVAILAHLNCTLKLRWQPDGGVVMRCFPKDQADG